MTATEFVALPLISRGLPGQKLFTTGCYAPKPHPMHLRLNKILAMALTVASVTACQNYDLLTKIEDPASSEIISCGSECRIFVTSNSFVGNLGGAAGADNMCMQDPANPLASGRRKWKAMLDAGSTRRACLNTNCSISGAAENIDWVMRPSTNYRRPDGTYIGTTGPAGIFSSGISNPIDLNGYSVWTGLNSNWQANTNCAGWIDSGGATGTAGSSSSITDVAINSTQPTCGSPNRLYCVEQ